MQSSSLQFGSTTIEYSVTFAKRQTAAVAVQPDLQVIITAPEGCELPTLEALIRKRAPWILRQQQQFAIYAPAETPRIYISGESYRYLGRQYRLKVLEGQLEEVRQERSLIYVTVPDRDNSKQVQNVLENRFEFT